jgi:hypothetical protein
MQYSQYWEYIRLPFWRSVRNLWVRRRTALNRNDIADEAEVIHIMKFHFTKHRKNSALATLRQWKIPGRRAPLTSAPHAGRSRSDASVLHHVHHWRARSAGLDKSVMFAQPHKTKPYHQRRHAGRWHGKAAPSRS